MDPVLSATGELTFGNAAVQYGFAPAPATYTATWGRFDNATGTSTRIGQTSGSQLRMQAPAGLPTTAGSFVEVELSAQHPNHPSWARPDQAALQARRSRVDAGRPAAAAAAGAGTGDTD